MFPFHNLAEFQSALLRHLKENFELTEKENQILNRGRNSVSKSNRRNPAAYQDATALEALIGYLYIIDTQRCSRLLNWIRDHLDEVESL